MKVFWILAAAVAVAVAACQTSSPRRDAGVADGSKADAGATDAPAADLRRDPPRSDFDTRDEAVVDAASDGAVETGWQWAASSGLSKCIAEWPVENGPHPVRLSLPVTAPVVVWSRVLNGSPIVYRFEAGPVLAGDRIAAQSADWIYFVDKDGKKAQEAKFTGWGEYPSGLVADELGNTYFASQSGTYSADATGRLRWRGPGGAVPEGDFGSVPAGVLGPDNVFYVVGADRVLYALRGVDGTVLWSVAVPETESESQKPVVFGGAGRALFLQLWSMELYGSVVLDPSTGEFLGGLRIKDGRRFSCGQSAFVADWTVGMNCSSVAMDRCGKERWNLLTPSGKAESHSSVIAAGELVV
jgi:hypothetical protein